MRYILILYPIFHLYLVTMLVLTGVGGQMVQGDNPFIQGEGNPMNATLDEAGKKLPYSEEQGVTQQAVSTTPWGFIEDVVTMEYKLLTFQFDTGNALITALVTVFFNLPANIAVIVAMFLFVRGSL